MGQTQYTNRFAIDPKTAATFGTDALTAGLVIGVAKITVNTAA
jgi:hypothetical protein